MPFCKNILLKLACYCMEQNGGGGEAAVTKYQKLVLEVEAEDERARGWGLVRASSWLWSRYVLTY